MKPRNAQVLKLFWDLPTVSLMDGQRALGMSGGAMTKAISDLRRRGVEISRETRKDPITGTKYPVYRMSSCPLDMAVLILANNVSQGNLFA